MIQNVRLVAQKAFSGSAPVDLPSMSFLINLCNFAVAAVTGKTIEEIASTSIGGNSCVNLFSNNIYSNDDIIKKITSYVNSPFFIPKTFSVINYNTNLPDIYNTSCSDGEHYALNDSNYIISKFFNISSDQNLLKNFREQAVGQVSEIPYSIPLKTHHIWYNDANISDTTLTIAQYNSAKFNSSWTHNFWVLSPDKVGNISGFNVTNLHSVLDSLAPLLTAIYGSSSLISNFLEYTTIMTILSKEGGVYLDNDYLLCSNSFPIQIARYDSVFGIDIDHATIGSNIIATKPNHPIINYLLNTTTAQSVANLYKSNYPYITEPCNSDALNDFLFGNLALTTAFYLNAFQSVTHNKYNIDAVFSDGLLFDSSKLNVSNVTQNLDSYCNAHQTLIGNYIAEKDDWNTDYAALSPTTHNLDHSFLALACY